MEATLTLPSAATRTAINPWFIAATVMLATFMEVLDTSVANVALPHIAGNLSASADEATWVLTAYLVANAIVLPLSGWFSTLFGRTRFYMACVAIFTVSSLLCGIAPSLPLLILFRIPRATFAGEGTLGSLRRSERHSQQLGYSCARREVLGLQSCIGSDRIAEHTAIALF